MSYMEGNQQSGSVRGNRDREQQVQKEVQSKNVMSTAVLDLSAPEEFSAEAAEVSSEPAGSTLQAVVDRRSIPSSTEINCFHFPRTTVQLLLSNNTSDASGCIK